MIEISYEGNMTVKIKCTLKAFHCYICYFISTLDSNSVTNVCRKLLREMTYCLISVFLSFQENKISRVIDELAQMTFISKSQLSCPNLFSSLELGNNDQKDSAMLMWS